MKNKKVLRGVLISLGVLFGLLLMLSIAAFVLGRTSYQMVSQAPDTYPYGGLGVDGIGGAPYAMSREEVDIGIIEHQYESDSRSLIKTGRISIAVDDIDQVLREVNILENTYSATTMNLSDYGKGLNRRVNMTIRVEQSQFDNLYRSLRTIEGESESSSMSVSDVTETILDLEARLNNYRSVEEQYLTILEQAESVEETLAVYQELNKIRLDIERVETQLKNLETQTEYSYIYFIISQSRAGAEVPDESWRPEGIFRDAIRALISFAQSIGSALIWVIVFSPVIALVVLPFIYLRKRAKK